MTAARASLIEVLEGSHSDLIPGIAAALAYAANNPGVIADKGTPLYASVMDAFQDIDHSVLHCSQWWICHYWTSGRTCSKCLEVVLQFHSDEPIPDQSREAIFQSISTGHDPACSFDSECTYDGLRVCLALNDPATDKKK